MRSFRNGDMRQDLGLLNYCGHNAITSEGSTDCRVEALKVKVDDLWDRDVT